MAVDLFAPAQHITVRDRLETSLIVMVGGGWAEAILHWSGYGFRDIGEPGFVFLGVWLTFYVLIWWQGSDKVDLFRNSCLFIAFALLAEIFRAFVAVIILAIVLPPARAILGALFGSGL